MSGLAPFFVATLVAASHVNNAHNYCACSANVVVTIPTFSVRYRARSAGTPDDISVSSWLALLPLGCSPFSVPAALAKNPNTSSPDVFSRSALHALGQTVKERKPESHAGASVFMVVLVSLARECYSVQKVAWRWKQFAIVVPTVFLLLGVSHQERILMLSWFAVVHPFL